MKREGFAPLVTIAFHYDHLEFTSLENLVQSNPALRSPPVPGLDFAEAIVLSSDGELVAIRDDDMVLIFNAKTLETLGTLRFPASLDFRAMRFAADELVFFAPFEGRIEQFHSRFRANELVDELCGRLQNNIAIKDWTNRRKQHPDTQICPGLPAQQEENRIKVLWRNVGR